MAKYTLVLRVSSDGTKPLHDTHARAHSAKDGVFIVEVWCRSQSNEELRTFPHMTKSAYRAANSIIHFFTVGIRTRIRHG